MFTLIAKVKNKFKYLNDVLYCLVVLLFFTCSYSYAEPTTKLIDTKLMVTPERCISLHKGQMCYLEVTFTWQHSTTNEVCLVKIKNSNILKCWHNVNAGEYSFDFQATESQNFALRAKYKGNEQNSTNLAVAKIIVASVYKSSKRTKASWRLF